MDGLVLVRACVANIRVEWGCSSGDGFVDFFVRWSVLRGGGESSR